MSNGQRLVVRRMAERSKAPSPQPSPGGRGSRSRVDSTPEPASKISAGLITLEQRGQHSARYFRSADPDQTPRSVPSTSGRGSRSRVDSTPEPASKISAGLITLEQRGQHSARYFRSADPDQTPRSVPSPSGRGNRSRVDSTPEPVSKISAGLIALEQRGQHSARYFRSADPDQTPRLVPFPSGRGSRSRVDSTPEPASKISAGLIALEQRGQHSARYFRSADPDQTPRSVPSPSGRGLE